MKSIISLFLASFFLVGLSANIIYCDPIQGNNSNPGTIDQPLADLESVINDLLIETKAYSPLPYDAATNVFITKNQGGVIKAGDTIMLMEGLHGDIFLRNYVNEKAISVIGMPGQVAILKKLKIQGGKNWKFENLQITSEAYNSYINSKLVHFETHAWQGPCSNIEIINCDIYSTENPWEMAEDWINKSSDGIYMFGDSMRAQNNRLRNIDMGITAYGDHIQAINNEVVNFSGDGMRVLGSDILFHQNIIKNCYDVDENHDDGIQSFTVNGIVVDDVTISANTIINFEDPNQPLRGPLQGIGCFDGFYNNWLIENNVVNVDHWHGITLLGANNCRIINNTVIDPTPDETPGSSWIRIDDHKDGSPSTNCVVKNNVSNKIVVTAEESNNIVLLDYDDYTVNFVDYSKADFHLLENSILIDSADISVAPLTDIDNNTRNQGFGPDIGAYEYMSPLTTGDLEIDQIAIFPNPTSDNINIKGTESTDQIIIYDMLGQVIVNQKARETHAIRFAPTLPAGPYILIVNNQENEKRYQGIIMKE